MGNKVTSQVPVCESCGRAINAAGPAYAWGRHTVCSACRLGLARQRVGVLLHSLAHWTRAKWRGMGPPWLVTGGAALLLVGVVLIGLWITRPYESRPRRIADQDYVYVRRDLSSSNLYHLGHCPHLSSTMWAMPFGRAKSTPRVPCPVCTSPAKERADRGALLVIGMASAAVGLVAGATGLVLLGRKSYAS